MKVQKFLSAFSNNGVKTRRQYTNNKLKKGPSIFILNLLIFKKTIRSKQQELISRIQEHLLEKLSAT